MPKIRIIPVNNSLIIKRDNEVLGESSVVLARDIEIDKNHFGEVILAGEKAKHCAVGDKVFFSSDDEMVIRVNGGDELSVVDDSKVLGFYDV